MALKDAQEKLAALVTEVEAIAAKEDFGVADAERIEAIHVEVEPIKAEIEAQRKAGDLSAYARQSSGGISLADPNKGSAAVVGFSPHGSVLVENNPESVLVSSDGIALMTDKEMAAIRHPDYGAAIRAYVRTKGWMGNQTPEAIKVLQEGLDVSGGYLVPEDIQNRVLQKEPTPTVMAGRVTRLTTGRDSMAFPKVTWTDDDLYTTGMRITWSGEIPASSTVHRVTEPVFGQVRIPIWTAMMSLVLTNDMVEDSGFDIMGYISAKFSETIELLFEDMIIQGSGTSRPEGILVNANAITNAVNSGATATLTGDGIVDLAFNLPPQYDQNSVFVMNKLNTGRTIFKLKDGDGRYLWSNNDEAGGLSVPKVRGDLLGIPILYSEFMPNATTASNKPIIYGDLSGYFLVQRVGFTIQILKELLAQTNQIIMLGRIRFGGALVEDWRLRLQNIST
ncbi:hypothetical protein LCGC14_0313400 [marine sediment metagenome]|uniref:Phage capsid-like C-terminal domain-containing protein n=1 Tax=marine sediment metagenome TaxID=412755 RepID=A0A0F9WTB8_9ZZZZ